VFQFRLFSLFIVIAVAATGWALTCGAWQLEREVDRVGPLETRDFARLTVITVGTGGAHENPDRRGPSTAIGMGDQIVLVDAGRAVADALRLSLIPVAQPDTVYLTSLLPENTVGLDDLLMIGWTGGRAAPLRVVGPTGTRALTQALAAAHRRGIDARAGALGIQSAAPRFEVVEIDGDWSEQIGELAVRAAALPGGPIDALAYRFESRDRSAVISGTGWAAAELIAFAQGANLLAHEAVYVPTPEQAEQMGFDADPEQLRREAAEHTAIDAVGALARAAGVGTLVLVRLRPPPLYDLQITSVVNDEFGGRIVIASDGDEITP
jgi:ribonuclease BN (tRNA processing enzyme)